jgi:glutathione S-transferase
MKLYFSPGACSLHPHIALREAGLSFDLVRVDLRAHKTKDGGDYYAINPKGYVPTLELDDGTRLTEGAVIDQYIADRKPESKLAPPAGTMERYRLQEWLNFIAAEVHKSFGPLFNPATPDDAKAQAKERIGKKLDIAERALEGRSYLLGETFSVADGYLFNMIRWTEFTGIDTSPWPKLQAFAKRVSERPAVKAALEAEKASS